MDKLQIEVDLSAYAIKEELAQAISNIDLSGYATTAYVDNAIANVPQGSGGDVDLSNYYTKEETYNKGEIANLIPIVKDGKDGVDGQDGFSPTATVSKSGNTATITITDKNGTTTASISEGKDGAGGGSSGGSGEVYSTEETAIGTWIDGRTIYRKAIDIGKLGTASSGNFGLIRQEFSDVDTDTIIRMTALVSYATTYIVVNGSFFNISLNPSTNMATYVASVTKSEFVFVGDNRRVAVYYRSGCGSYSCTMIIEYTKAS